MVDVRRLKVKSLQRHNMRKCECSLILYCPDAVTQNLDFDLQTTG